MKMCSRVILAQLGILFFLPPDYSPFPHFMYIIYSILYVYIYVMHVQCIYIYNANMLQPTWNLHNNFIEFILKFVAHPLSKASFSSLIYIPIYNTMIDRGKWEFVRLWEKKIFKRFLNIYKCLRTAVVMVT